MGREDLDGMSWRSKGNVLYITQPVEIIIEEPGIPTMLEIRHDDFAAATDLSPGVVYTKPGERVTIHNVRIEWTPKFFQVLH